MNAMTWYDHTTQSVWSQVWGRAIEGSLKGTELELISSQTVPWGSWKEQHPQTLLMINDIECVGGMVERFQPNYVIGVNLAGVAKAYPYKTAVAQRVINDQLDDLAILVIGSEEMQSISVFIRQVGDRVLTFEMRGDDLVDRETNSRWDPVRGMATEGPLRGEALKSLPYVPAFAPAWQDFYPDSETYAAR